MGLYKLKVKWTFEEYWRVVNAIEKLITKKGVDPIANERNTPKYAQRILDLLDIDIY